MRLHLGGIAGSVTNFVLHFGPVLLVLSPLVVLIAWARWKLKVHSPLQAQCGAALATAVTVTTFWCFGLR